MVANESLAVRGKTVLILGGGIGGIVTAKKLRAALPKQHRIIVVERESTFVFAPSLLWLMVGGRTAKQISRSMAGLGTGIELVRGEIQKIDVERREAVVDGKTLSGDYLVISLGAEYAPETIPGLSEAGHNFYNLAGAESARDALAKFAGGRLIVMTSTPLYKCPAAPYEATMLISNYLKKRKVRDKTQLAMYAAEAAPMPVAGPDVGKWLRKMYEHADVAYHPEHVVAEVDPAARKLKFKNGAEANYDLLIYVPPHRAPRVVRESGLTSETGWIPVDRHTHLTKHERVFAIGDVVYIPLALGKPLPKAGTFTDTAAKVVAQSIALEITGKGKTTKVTGDGDCFIEVGHGMAAIGSGNFYAEPLPTVTLRKPGFHWHWGKVMLEKYFLWKWL